MGYFGDTPYEVAETIAKDVAAMNDPEQYAMGYVYAFLEDHNYHSETRAMEAKFGPLSTEAYDVAGGVYYDYTPGSSYDFDFNVGHELAMIVAERNFTKLAQWLERV